mmetsp:Transcript_4980/g.10733  ORF Transcript_4980/g.10733 Transcript_4980/m.10733 type:complete len:262 (+) Transcript_4980:506-1291(+)
MKAGSTALHYLSGSMPYISCTVDVLQPRVVLLLHCSPLLALGEGLQVLHLLLGADVEGHALVDRLGLDVQHACLAGGAGTASLLCNEGHGCALVEQAELAVLVLLVTGVAVDASVQQGAVEVTDQGANVAGAVGLAVPLGGVLQAGHVVLHALVPQVGVALVEGVDLANLGDLDVPVCQHELSHQGVQGEAVHAVADGEHHDVGAAVQAVAGAAQVLARLTHIHHALLHHLLGVIHGIQGALLAGGVHAEDGADGDTGINV